MSRNCFILFLVLGNLIEVVPLECPLDPPKACFTQQELNDEINSAKRELDAIESNLERFHDYPGFAMSELEPAYGHFKTHEVSQADIDDHHLAIAVKTALKRLQNIKGLTRSQLQRCIESPALSLAEYCTPKPLDCNPKSTNYYTDSGMCNNKLHPTWGAEGTPFIRMFESGSYDYTKLPSARSESSALHDRSGFSADKPPGFNNDMCTMSFQMMTHETMNTKRAQHSTEKRGGGYNCCNPKNDTFLAGLIKMNPNCMPVDVPRDDFCFGNSIKSLNYIASFKVLDNCKLTDSPLSKNFETAFIDGKLIYNKKSMNMLERNGGKFNVKNNVEMKAHIVDYDERSMQLPGLFLFLNLFTFLHNIIFDNLKTSKPSLNSTQLIFECRKFVTAAFQKTYLDMVINVMPDAERRILSSFFNCYDPNLHPQVSLEHNLCLRSMHSFIRDNFASYPESSFTVPNGLKGRRPSDVDISTMMDNLTMYTDNKCGHTHGLLDNTWNIAGSGPNILCNFMAPPKTMMGSDLRMMDFQAAHDNSEPAYVTAAQKLYNVKKCPSAMTKDDLPKHDFDTKNFLNKHYNGDISKLGFLFGVLNEDRGEDVMSPTEMLVIIDQMKRTVCGDRFWFSNGFALNQKQIDLISNLDLATIICLVNDCNGTRIQSDAFCSASSGNTKKVCFSKDEILASFDLANNW